MLYTGVDMVEIARIEESVSRLGERFLRRVYSPAELDICAGRIESLAARWAAKEAVAKLLGVGLRGIGAGPESGAVSLLAIETLADARRRPLVRLSDSALSRARELQIEDISLSLAHERGLAIAFAVALTGA